MVDSKDGIGKLGTIVDESGIVGQARWIKVDEIKGKESIVLPVIAIACVAVAIFGVEKKVKEINSGVNKVYKYLEAKDSSQIKANIDVLKEIYNTYSYFVGNKYLIQSNLDRVMKVKDSSIQFIYQYEELIKQNKKIVSEEERYKIMVGNLRKLNFVLYSYALALFMEILLSSNFESCYLNYNLNELNARCGEYEIVRKEVLKYIKHHEKKAKSKAVMKIGTKCALDSIIFATDPIKYNTNIENEYASNAVMQYQNEIEEMEYIINKTLIDEDQFFAKEIKMIDKLYNDEKMLLFNEDSIYVCEDIL